ncbi:peptidoglycan binding domain-containing protein [Kitasatospora arboriphila]
MPKTETTLTTRIRINIPGSRPIPPVVVRSPVKNEEPAAGAGAPGPRSEGTGSPVLGLVDAGTADAPANLPPQWQDGGPQGGPAGGPAGGQGRPDGTSESESTGAWFRPRQKGRQDAGPAPVAVGAPGGAPQPGPQAAAAAAQAAPQAAPPGAPRPAAGAPRPAAQGAPQTTPPGPRGPVPGERRAAPRPGGAPASPFAGGPEGAPQDPFAAPTADPFAAPAQGRPDGGGQRPAGRFAADPFAGPAQGRPAAAPGAPGGEPRRAPADPFGPAPVQENPFRTGPADPFAAGRAAGAVQPEPEDTQVGGFEPIRDEGRPGGSIPGVPTASLFGSAPPAADPFAGPADPFGGAPAQPDPFAAPADPFAPGPAPAAADPFTDPFGGVPAQADPFGGPFGAAAPDRGRPGPAAAEAAPAPAPAPEPLPPKAGSAEPAPKKRGKARKLASYAVGGVLFAGAAAYGTGLMLNQADIPKGTTVLGTDIGGDTRDQAVSALDDSVAKTGKEPIKLKLGGQALSLDPATAGLSFDTTGTVDGLTKHSYNPVEVIGSLAGGTKAVAPEVKVDQSKLKAALDELAAKSGQGVKEGFVRFTETGQTEVVPGKAGQGLDSAAAAAQVEQAYRDRAAGRRGRGRADAHRGPAEGRRGRPQGGRGLARQAGPQRQRDAEGRQAEVGLRQADGQQGADPRPGRLRQGRPHLGPGQAGHRAERRLRQGQNPQERGARPDHPAGRRRRHRLGARQDRQGPGLHLPRLIPAGPRGPAAPGRSTPHGPGGRARGTRRSGPGLRHVLAVTRQWRGKTGQDTRPGHLPPRVTNP